MYRSILGCVAVLMLCGTLRAQEQPTPAQYQKMYTDALQQLKAAQDRKNELSAANEKLTQANAQLQQQIASLHKQVADLQEQKDHFDEKTFFLRAFHAAWRQFIAVHPYISLQWREFIGGDVPLFTLPPLLPQPAAPTTTTAG